MIVVPVLSVRLVRQVEHVSLSSMFQVLLNWNLPLSSGSIRHYCRTDSSGDGVCIAGESFWVDTHDVVVRHMRFRRGETKVWHRDDSFGGNPIGNIMIDHCSCTWGLDENISFYRHMYDPSEGQYESKDLKLPTVNVTIQNTISAKALDTYNHAFGSTLGVRIVHLCVTCGQVIRDVILPSVGMVFSIL